MGTRHLICVVLDGDFRAAQYGQWDGQPHGAGAEVVRFLRRVDLETFKARVRACRPATPHEMGVTFLFEMAFLRTLYDLYAGRDQEHLIRSYLRRGSTTHLSPECGVRILDVIYGRDEPGGLPIIDEREIAGDSAFCRWAYVIDLDAGTLEIYEGHNREPTPPDSRFPSGAEWLANPNDGFHPVRLVKTYDLSNLPADFGREADIIQWGEDEEDADG